MKIFITLIALFFYLSANAQDYITYSGHGSIIMNDGKTLEGIVSYSLSSPGTVHIKVGEEKKVKYKAKEVKEFFVDDKHYYALKAKGEIGVGSDMVFAYLISSDKAKFKLFRYETQPSLTNGNTVPITTEIYVALPESGTDVYTLSDMKLNPSKKLAKYITDCPALSTKITGKEKDYSYGMITSDAARQSVIEKINADYFTCK